MVQSFPSLPRAISANGGLLRRSWRDVEGQHSQFPGIAFTTINCGIVSLLLYRTPVFALNSVTPFSITPHLIPYNVRGKLIVLANMVAEMDSLEQVCSPFLDGLSTVNRSHVGPNR
jgi:hypothetical protein